MEEGSAENFRPNYRADVVIIWNRIGSRQEYSMKINRLMGVALIAVLGACANRNAIVDTKGVDEAQYQQDYRECEVYAEQVSTGEAAAKSAGFGAVVSGAITAVLGGDSSAIARSAGAGAVGGGASGALQGESEKGQVLRNCLRGRGYRVLN